MRPFGALRSTENPSKEFSEGTGGHCILQALAARGIEHRYLGRDQITNSEVAGGIVAEFSINGSTYYIGGGCLRVTDPQGTKVPGPPIDGPTARFTRKKNLVKKFLRRHGFHVPEGTVFFRDQQSDAEAFFSDSANALEGGLCLKPANGKWGRQVFVGIRDLSTFRAAFADVGRSHERILVEETVPGRVYRFTCIGGKVIGVDFGEPPNVAGDGSHTIAQLVRLKNAQRRLNPAHSRPLRLRRKEREFLRQDGHDPEEVLEKGTTVYLSTLSNLHQGGESIMATDAMHESYLELVERVLNHLPDLVFCGVDIAITDLERPAAGDNYHILELNRCPGFANYHYPWHGKPLDVAGAIVDYLVTREPVEHRDVPPSRNRKPFERLADLWSGQARKAARTRSLPTRHPRTFAKGGSGDCLVEALRARGIEYRYLTSDQITHPKLGEKRRVITFTINEVTYYFDGGSLRVADKAGNWVPGPLIDGPVARFVKNKDLVKARLAKRGISVPEGAAFRRSSRKDAEVFFSELLHSSPAGICVKPTDANKGRHVHVGIQDVSAFRSAFAAVGMHHGRVLVEKTVTGIVYRFTCLAGRVLAVEFGRPANVEGDGVHTISELVALKNVERRLNPGHAATLLRLRQRECDFLDQAGLHPDHVPSEGQSVALNSVSNLHQGADFIDVTDAVHPSYIELVERAVTCLPNLVLGGADVVIEEAKLPANDENYHVLEVNCGPGFQTNHSPWQGQPRDIAGAIVDYLMPTPANSPDSPPISTGAGAQAETS